MGFGLDGSESALLGFTEAFLAAMFAGAADVSLGQRFGRALHEGHDERSIFLGITGMSEARELLYACDFLQSDLRAGMRHPTPDSCRVGAAMPCSARPGTQRRCVCGAGGSSAVSRHRHAALGPGRGPSRPLRGAAAMGTEPRPQLGRASGANTLGIESCSTVARCV